jgi:hypothetical protein
LFTVDVPCFPDKPESQLYVSSERRVYGCFDAETEGDRHEVSGLWSILMNQPSVAIGKIRVLCDDDVKPYFTSIPLRDIEAVLFKTATSWKKEGAN